MELYELECVIIGNILAPWGIKGKLKVQAITDFPERLTPGSRVYINRQPVTIESTEWHKGHAIIKLKDINSIKEAERLRGRPVEIHRSQLQLLPEGQYYYFQLIGLEVRTTSGERLGKITEIVATQSNDNYVVSGVRGKIFIPAIKDVVKSIDLNQRCMIIEPIAGLLTLNEKTTNSLPDSPDEVD